MRLQAAGAGQQLAGTQALGIRQGEPVAPIGHCFRKNCIRRVELGLHHLVEELQTHLALGIEGKQPIFHFSVDITCQQRALDLLLLIESQQAILRQRLDIGGDQRLAGVQLFGHQAGNGGLFPFLQLDNDALLFIDQTV